MKVKQCKLDYCETELTSLGEVATSLCDWHRKLLEAKNSYAGVCWNCGRLQVIQEIPRHLRGAFTEKYLFSHGCSQCTPDIKDYEWLTFSKFEPKKRLAISPTGQLVEELITQSKGGTYG
jgi:hypothetical protein